MDEEKRLEKYYKEGRIILLLQKLDLLYKSHEAVGDENSMAAKTIKEASDTIIDLDEELRELRDYSER